MEWMKNNLPDWLVCNFRHQSLHGDLQNKLGIETKLVSIFYVKSHIYTPSQLLLFDSSPSPLTSSAVFPITGLSPSAAYPLLCCSNLTGTFQDQNLCLLNLNETGCIPSVCMCVSGTCIKERQRRKRK